MRGRKFQAPFKPWVPANKDPTRLPSSLGGIPLPGKSRHPTYIQRALQSGYAFVGPRQPGSRASMNRAKACSLIVCILSLILFFSPTLRSAFHNSLCPPASLLPLIVVTESRKRYQSIYRPHPRLNINPWKHFHPRMCISWFFLGEILSGGSKKLRSNFVYEILRGKWLAWLFFKKVNKIK
jgi:hypothetical protein